MSKTRLGNVFSLYNPFKSFMRVVLSVCLLVAGLQYAQAFDDSVDHLLEGGLLCSRNASSAPKAFDGDASTYFDAGTPDMQYVGLDLGTAHVVTRIVFTPASTSAGPDRMLLSLFEGANEPDFMDAVPLYLISSTPAEGGETSVDINVSRGFRYVRYVGGAGSYCQVAELKFYGHEGAGDDSRFYQITNIPTMSIHVSDNAVPVNRGEDFESRSTLIYDGGTLVQEYPVLVRVRGNFSATPDNKPYRVKFNDGKSHRMMKGSSVNESTVKAKKWVLLNSWRDKTLMRNPVAWEMSKLVGPKFTPWCQPVDLILNGDYRGTYVLADHISVHEGRIDITEMDEDDVDGEALTGGYFVEVDNNATREPYYFYSNHGNPISVHDPDDDVMQPQQFQYIKDTFNAMEDVVFGDSYADPDKGYASVLDVESFLKYFLISEFNGNTDMLCQVFMYKERGDAHFYTGPVWDHELALDDDATVYPGNNRADWTYTVRQTGKWGNVVTRILSDPAAMQRLQAMWATLRDDSLFTKDNVTAKVDSLRRDMRQSANLNFIRWPYLNQYISLTPAVRGSWEAEVDVVRNYVKNRVAWMDRKLHYDSLEEENGVYRIDTPRDLCTFAGMVSSGNTKANAVLAADIDMKDFSDRFVPIGTASKPYSGTFDGGGHIISNLQVTGTDCVGLFGVLGMGADIKGVNIDSTCEFRGDNYVAALAGYVRNGTVSISECTTAAKVTATGSNAAGLAGISRLVAKLYVTRCCNTGNISASAGAASLVASSMGQITVAHSFNTGQVEGGAEDDVFASSSMKATLTNCYDILPSQACRVTKAQVSSGELCFMLNGNDGDKGDYWRQNLDNGKTRDASPVPYADNGTVYRTPDGYSNFMHIPGSYRYYKLLITAIGGGSTIQFSEFDLLDESKSEVTDMKVYAGTESSISKESWPNVADNKTSTKYCSGGFSGSTYFLFDATREVAITGYRFYTANDTRKYPERNPKGWQLYGSNAYTSDAEDKCWELIDTRTDDNTLEAVNYTPYDFLLENSSGGVVESIALNAATEELEQGDSLVIAATVEPRSMMSAGLLWKSTAPQVASVTQDGMVKALTPGETDIVVTAPHCGSASATLHLTVNKPSYTLGDINGDGRIDGTDLVAMFNIITGNAGPSHILKAADMNRDGEVNLSDTAILISQILSED